MLRNNESAPLNARLCLMCTTANPRDHCYKSGYGNWVERELNFG